MRVIDIIERDQLDSFVDSQKMSQFLQSWEWGELQKGVGRKIWRIGILEENKLIASALLVKHQLPFSKNYLYCPRGPVTECVMYSVKCKMIFNELLKKIVEIAKQENSIFIRIEPPIEKLNTSILDSLVAKDYQLVPTKFVQPKNTLILDLSKSEDELLSEMHHKTRYNIRLAKRKGVKISIGDIKNFEIFWKLNLDTSERDKFSTHPKEYYRKMLEVLEPKGFLKLFMAEYQGKPLVANLVVLFSDTVTYIHGASSNEYRNLMAPYLAQWEQILEAKKQGFRYYDFWGIMPGLQTTDYSPQSDHSWAGITRFKKGFGGFEVNYIGTFDLILNKFWYKMYKLGRNFLRN